MPNRSSILAAALATVCAPLTAQQDDDFARRARAHYARAERELRGHDVSHLTEAQRAARETALAALRAYRERGEFGVNDRFADIRMPFFVDRAGRRCAVAHLLDATGAGVVTDDIAARQNHVWVAELDGDPRLAAWLDQNGLTLVEAARVQYPSRRGNPGGRAPIDTVPPVVVTPSRWAPEPSGTPRGPTGDGAAPRSPAGGTATPRIPTAAAPAAAGGPATGGMPLGAVLADESWTAWWDWNRASFLDAKAAAAGGETAGADSGPVTGMGAGPGSGRAAFGPAERAAARTRLLPALEDPIADVRAAACLALGRLGHADDVPAILDRLADPDHGVRNDAILALGANATPVAVRALSQLALRGHVHGDAADAPVTHLAAPLATVALGLARRRGARSASEDFVGALATAQDGADGERMRTAVLLYADMQDDVVLRDLAHAFLAERELDVAVRCRAVETLDFGDPASRRPILETLAGREISLRRSAALALGRSDEPLALPSLMTAFELENERFTQALILLAIGEHDADDARDFLIEQLREGSKTLRAWAALGLGIWSRGRDDATGRAAIRAGWKRERNQDQATAYLLAMGLAEDPDAVDLLADIVQDGSSSLARSIAAEALALCGSDATKDVLRRQLVTDSCPYARSVAAEVLGAWRDPADAERLIAALDDATTPDERIRLANALGRLGGRAAHDALVGVLDADGLAPRERAAAILALGQTLDPRGLERHLPALARTANFTVFPDWLAAVLATAL